MIQASSIAIMLFNGLICFGIPIGGYLFVRKKPGKYMGVFIGGALSFYLTQMVVRIPLLQAVLPQADWYVKLARPEGWLFPVGIALFLGFTAALFETFGRFLTLNFLLKNKLSYRSGIIHGLGHGGIEAVLLVGINHIIYGFYALRLNSGVAEPFLMIIPTEQQELLRTILEGTKPSAFFAAGYERLLAIVLHMALSLLMTVGIVKGKKVLYTLIVLFIHTLVDAVAVVLVNYTSNILLIEAVVTLFAIGAAIIIYANKNAIHNSIDVDDAEKAVDEGY